MKKRIIKKYINRYINPVIKDLPKTEYGAFQVDVEGNVQVRGKNHTIVNGEVKGEGFRHNMCQDILRNIRLTGLKAQEIIDKHGEVYLRLFEIRGNYARMRLITE
jgi:hypothetical protein